MITLKPGDKAPVFTGTDQNGKKVSLKDYRGKKLVLYFYPGADTPTCTIQSCNLRDHYTLLRKKGLDVLGVSPDQEKAQKRFEQKFDLPFRLVADRDHVISNAYGVWGMKKLFGHQYLGIQRTTFLIDEKGKVLRVFAKPINKTHAEEILAALK
ncbi:MAG: thioredoxin-dependent thiol peroxidase [Chitinophagaceae bacterium]